jgi:hypothetical protein
MLLFQFGNFMQIMQISWALLGMVSPGYFAYENVKQKLFVTSSMFSMLCKVTVMREPEQNGVFVTVFFDTVRCYV